MTPCSTHQMIRQAGAVAVTVMLLLTLLVVVLRLASIPFALAAVALDKSADLAGKPLTFSVPSSRGGES